MQLKLDSLSSFNAETERARTNETRGFYFLNEKTQRKQDLDYRANWHTKQLSKKACLRPDSEQLDPSHAKFHTLKNPSNKIVYDSSVSSNCTKAANRILFFYFFVMLFHIGRIWFGKMHTCFLSIDTKTDTQAAHL